MSVSLHQVSLFILSKPSSLSRRCFSGDLSSCWWECKYTQTVSHHHFLLLLLTLQSLLGLPLTVNHQSSSYISHSPAISQPPSAFTVSSNAAYRIHYRNTFKPAVAAHLHQSGSFKENTAQHSLGVFQKGWHNYDTQVAHSYRENYTHTYRKEYNGYQHSACEKLQLSA